MTKEFLYSENDADPVIDQPRRKPATLPRPFAAKQVLDKKLWEEGRARIAEAALPLFVRHGYHATPVRAIANSAGLSVGSIFNYFADKDELLEYILDESQLRCERAVAEAQEQVERELAALGPASSPIKLFLKVFRRHVQYTDEVRSYALLAYQEAKALTREKRIPILERDVKIRGILRRAAEPAVKAAGLSADSLDFKIHSLLMLAHMWAIRGWALTKYKSVDEYFAELAPIAVAILSAPSPKA
ncbi:MAG: TetR/AcrR family transcriptional regulator [Candidatus Binataceae bacterium]